MDRVNKPWLWSWITYLVRSEGILKFTPELLHMSNVVGGKERAKVKAISWYRMKRERMLSEIDLVEDHLMAWLLPHDGKIN